MVGKSSSTLRYMDAAVQRDEGKLCFVKRKSKELVSNCRRFCEKNISIFEKRERLNKNLWTFFRNASSFLCFLPAFFEKTPVPFAHGVTHGFLIRTSVHANGHAPAHRALSEFEILAFTLHLHPQLIDTVCIAREEKPLSLSSPVKETGVKCSHVSHCFIVSYSRMVKR